MMTWSKAYVAAVSRSHNDFSGYLLFVDERSGVMLFIKNFE